MAAAVAGEVLGPRPGKAACSFPQGIVEIMLRVCTSVVSGVAIVTSALVLAFTITYSPSSTTGSVTDNSTIAVAVGGSAAAGGILMVASLIGLLWEIVMIVLRFLNIGLLNLKPKIFLSVDIIAQLLLGVIFVITFFVAAVFAAQWNGKSDAVLGCLIVAAILSVVLVALMGVLAVWMIVYLVSDWTDKIIKYTLKDAVMG